jgi:hypothetical protein
MGTGFGCCEVRLHLPQVCNFGRGWSPRASHPKFSLETPRFKAPLLREPPELADLAPTCLGGINPLKYFVWGNHILAGIVGGVVLLWWEFVVFLLAPCWIFVVGLLGNILSTFFQPDILSCSFNLLVVLVCVILSTCLFFPVLSWTPANYQQVLSKCPTHVQQVSNKYPTTKHKYSTNPNKFLL